MNEIGDADFEEARQLVERLDADVDLARLDVLVMAIADPASFDIDLPKPQLLASGTQVSPYRDEIVTEFDHYL